MFKIIMKHCTKWPYLLFLIVVVILTFSSVQSGLADEDNPIVLKVAPGNTVSATLGGKTKTLRILKEKKKKPLPESDDTWFSQPLKTPVIKLGKDLRRPIPQPDKGNRLPAPPPPSATDHDGGTGTWLTARGLGSAPQPLLGFWLNDRGSVVRFDYDKSEGKLKAKFPSFSPHRIDQYGKPWNGVDTELEPSKRKGSNTWTGITWTIPIDKKLCPDRGWWEPASMIITGDVTKLRGAWRGPKFDEETCKLTEEIHSGTVGYTRHIASRFIEFLPGKYIHYVGAPTAGQHKVAVRIAVDVSETPGLTVRPHVDGQALQNRGGGIYEFVANRIGRHEIKVEFVNNQGKAVHTDILWVDVPRI